MTAIRRSSTSVGAALPSVLPLILRGVWCRVREHGKYNTVRSPATMHADNRSPMQYNG